MQLMHIYQLLPYVLSTSFSTHPKRLTWDKKRPPFTFFGTMRLTGNFKKIPKNSEIFFLIFFVFWELLLSPVVEKVVFVFLSLRYGADLGRSRLVFLNVSTFQIKYTNELHGKTACIFRSRKIFRLRMQSCRFFSDVSMKISNFSKTVHTIFYKVLHSYYTPKGAPACAKASKS